MIEIYDFRYEITQYGPCDRWSPKGIVFKHHYIVDGDTACISKPMLFDEENLIITTYSGSIYKIMSFLGDKEKQINWIKEDVKRPIDIIK